MKNRIISVVLSFFVIVNIILIACAFNVTPLTIKRDTFVYEYGSEISTKPQDYINANEAILSQVILNFSNLKNEIGEYKVSATYLGVEYPLNTEVYAIDLIEKVEDNSDIAAYFIDENGEKSTHKVFTEKGSYVERIIVEDQAGNQSASLRVKIVAGQNGNNPTLTGIDDIEVLKNSKFNPLDGVKATDGSGNDITTDKVGDYEVIYSITNDKGHNLQRTRRVSVIKTEKAGE